MSDPKTTAELIDFLERFAANEYAPVTHWCWMRGGVTADGGYEWTFVGYTSKEAAEASRKGRK